MHAHTRAHRHARAHTHTNTHTHARVEAHVCMHACMHVCMHACPYTPPLSPPSPGSVLGPDPFSVVPVSPPTFIQPAPPPLQPLPRPPPCFRPCFRPCPPPQPPLTLLLPCNGCGWRGLRLSLRLLAALGFSPAWGALAGKPCSKQQPSRRDMAVAEDFLSGQPKPPWFLTSCQTQFYARDGSSVTLCMAWLGMAASAAMHSPARRGVDGSLGAGPGCSTLLTLLTEV